MNCDLRSLEEVLNKHPACLGMLASKLGCIGPALQTPTSSIADFRWRTSTMMSSVAPTSTNYNAVSIGILQDGGATVGETSPLHSLTRKKANQSANLCKRLVSSTGSRVGSAVIIRLQDANPCSAPKRASRP